jgi:transketolase
MGEVGLALAAKTLLDAEGLPTRVVSMPSTATFDREDAAWRADVLPEAVPKVAIEAGSTALWWKYVRGNGCVVGIDRFGESAPGGVLFDHFGFTPQKIAEIARAL